LYSGVAIFYGLLDVYPIVLGGPWGRATLDKYKLIKRYWLVDSKRV